MTLLAEPTAQPLPRASAVPGRLSFDGVLRSEWIKLLSLRSILWSIGVMLILSWAGSILMAAAMAGTEFATADAIPLLVTQAGTFTSNLTVLVMGVLGVLAITNEYSSGMMLSTLSAVPKRTPVFAAKALVVASLGLVVGALSTFGGALIAAILFGSDGFAAFGQPEVLVSLLGTTFYLTLAGLLSYGIGALLRSSAGAISIVVVLMFVSTLVFQILMITGWEWVMAVAEWLPADLGNQLATSALMTDVPADEAGVGYWAALGGLAVWAAAALVPAAILFETRDAV